MKKSVKERFNNIVVSGVIVKEDAKVNAAGTFARFRMVVDCDKPKDAPGIFRDVVCFATKDKAIPVSLLKKGAKIKVSGRFRLNALPLKEGQSQQYREEIVAEDITESAMIEIEVDDAPEAPANDPGDLPGDIAGDGVLENIPEML